MGGTLGSAPNTANITTKGKYGHALSRCEALKTYTLTSHPVYVDSLFCYKYYGILLMSTSHSITDLKLIREASTSLQPQRPSELR